MRTHPFLLASALCGAFLEKPTFAEQLYPVARAGGNVEKAEWRNDRGRWELINRSFALREREIQIRERELGIQSSMAAQDRFGPRLSDAEEILVLEDEFDDLDPRLWQHEITMAGGGNNEFQVYVNNRSNSWAEDGVLYIQPTLTADWIGEKRVSGEEPFELDLWGMNMASACTNNMFSGCRRASSLETRTAINPIQSAQITTARSFSFKYGRVEMRAKIPKGDWIFPAFWMMPSEAHYGDWPASGEIDILEARGNPPGYTPPRPEKGGYDTYSCCAHWGPTPELNQFNHTFDWYQGSMEPNHTLADEWHTYGLYWDETGVYTYLDTDDNRVLEVPFDRPAWERGNLSRFEGVDNPWKGRSNTAPFDRPFYLVLNVAIGGKTTYFLEEFGKKPWTVNDTDAMLKFWEARDDWLPTWNGLDSAFKIDSVRVWQRRKDIELVSTPRALSLMGPPPLHTAYAYLTAPATEAAVGALPGLPEAQAAASSVGGGGSSGSGGNVGSGSGPAVGSSPAASAGPAPAARPAAAAGDDQQGSSQPRLGSCVMGGVTAGALMVGAFVLAAAMASRHRWWRWQCPPCPPADITTPGGVGGGDKEELKEPVDDGEEGGGGGRRLDYRRSPPGTRLVCHAGEVLAQYPSYGALPTVG